jgi:RHS repeat-associated protein
VSGSTPYTYDALGRLVAAGTAALTYSGQDDLVASDGQATYSRDSDGTVTGVKITSSGSAMYAWTDLHTDVVGLFAVGGTGMSSWTVYDPLGNVVGSSGTQLSLGYQSDYTDSGSGQVDMDSRWYSPSEGQFTSSDSIDQSADPDADNADSYAYDDDSPMLDSDPSGHDGEAEILELAEEDLALDDAAIELYISEIEAYLTAEASAAAAAAEVDAFVSDVQMMADDIATQLDISTIDLTITIGAEAMADMTAADVAMFLDFIWETFEYWVENDLITVNTSGTDTSTTTSTTHTTTYGGGTSTEAAPKPVIWMTQAQADELSAEGRTKTIDYSNYIGANPVDLAKYSKGPKMTPVADIVNLYMKNCTQPGECVDPDSQDDGGDTCMSNRPDEGAVDNTRPDGNGWIAYDETSENGRANGAEACIDETHDKFETKAIRPANWKAAVRATNLQMGFPANKSTFLASCHNIPAVMGGSNSNRANLTPCVHIGTNIDGYSMRWIEAFAVSFADAGFIVDYKVTDDYYSDESTIPNGFSYTVTIWGDAGSPPIQLTAKIENEYDDDAIQVNIGN